MILTAILPECIVIMVIRGFELDIHQENCGKGRCNEYNLHERVVRRDECGEQV